MGRRLAVWQILFLVSAGLVAASQQAAAPDSTGVIAGRVVDAQSKQPLAGVVLQLGPANAATGAARQNRVVTDARGRFVFSGLARGGYFVAATVGGNGFSPNGFVVTGMGFPIGAYLAGGFGQRRPSGPLRPIELAEGQRVVDAEIGLWKSAVVSGRVLDEAGEPLVGQVVGVVQVSSEGRLLNGPTMRTDDLGAYRFSGLVPGNYVVFVPQTQVSMPVSTGDELAAAPPDPTARQRFSSTSAPSPSVGGVRVGSSIVSTTPDPARFPAGTTFSNSSAPILRDASLFAYPTTFHPSSVSLADGARIRLAAGDERENVDVQLRPVPASSLAGVVVDDAGPVSGLGLRLMPSDQGEEASILEAAHTATDSRGAFVFPIVPAGSYTLVAWRVGGVPTGNQQQPYAQPTRISEQSGAWAMQSVVVANQPVHDVKVIVRPPVRVTGRVEFSGASARPPAERLRTSFMTTIFRVNTMFRTPGPSAGSFIDPATGRISVTGVSPPGRYLAGPPALPAPWSLESITLAGQDVMDAGFAVGESDINDLVITFTDRPASLSGSVTGAVAEATVFVFPAGGTRWQDGRIGSRTFRMARPSTTGAFTLPNMPPGDYLAVAIRDEDAGDWPDALFIARLAAVATSVKIPANQPATVTLKVSTLK
ncbi:MAG TPA: carboxypeptidase regulatory-like domain-containing protein [Vicinamibacterales bacterium]|nr:carboxypeptidase regulatory-like domain-containing protein [Vicinamibacterales bacterium]